MNQRLMIHSVAGVEFLDRGDVAAQQKLMLLHGYGADMHDLAGLAPHLSSLQEGRWVFPNAPLRVPIGPHMEGRAWFPINAAALEASFNQQEPLTFDERDGPELMESGVLVSGLIHKLALNYEGCFLLGGFSQGGMVAMETVLTQDVRPRALILMSTTLAALSRWKELMPLKEKFPVFVSHGREDPLLPFSGAERVAAFWQKHGHEVTFVPFQGGHEITYPVLKELNIFLEHAVTNH